jgi:hypothetical protein
MKDLWRERAGRLYEDEIYDASKISSDGVCKNEGTRIERKRDSIIEVMT